MISQGFTFLREIDDTKHKHQLVLELVKLLVKKESEDLKWNSYISDEEDSTSTSGPLREQLSFSQTANTINDTLMLSAKHGIVEIVGVILEECPWAIEFLDKNGKNILHLAVKYRQAGVFKLLKSKRLCLNKMVAEVDNEGNTPLHLVAKHHEKNFYVTAYEMTREIHWFKQVKDVSQVHTYHLRNSEGKTADEIFNDTHQILLSKSVEWAKKTTNTFMVVSTLIATVNFSAAFAVPGGYDQYSGIPVFTSKTRDLPWFYAYSTVALFFSVVTLGSSFSAYLSRFHSEDFHFFLPLKYLIGDKIVDNE
ncbi:protein ACCELERATED CELL DEATH 6-like [Telopea speciosissima]|uniref:protein ACCELERATED CELL DEATH 6-like n=1 Tax=Telopea speciosissima TaxID=54955 RepID=UPI001CC5067C|nr:protein ACCELERATED CELL DEATH 6-like [Telopea speciosissima]